jgi:hypothetical protein
MQQTSSESSTFEQSLLALLREGLITDETGSAYATNETMFAQMKLGTYAVPSLDTMVSRHR